MASDDELARLRARAYAPNADISDDDAAMARLDALENDEKAGGAPSDHHDEVEQTTGTSDPLTSLKERRSGVRSTVIVGLAATAGVAVGFLVLPATIPQARPSELAATATPADYLPAAASYGLVADSVRYVGEYGSYRLYLGLARQDWSSICLLAKSQASSLDVLDSGALPRDGIACTASRSWSASLPLSGGDIAGLNYVPGSDDTLVLRLSQSVGVYAGSPR